MSRPTITPDYIRQTLKASLRNMRQLLLEQESVYTYYQKLGVLFISIPKVANSSINYLLLERSGLLPEDVSDYNGVHEAKNRLRIPRRMVRQLPVGTFRFAFVRNPFDRIASLYRNKVVNEQHAITRKYFGLIYPGMPFADFARAVSRIPDRLADAHFKSQYYWLYDRNCCIADYIGHYETLADDFRPIRERLQLGDLPALNTSTPYRSADLYDLCSSEAIYRRYRNDIMTFGYEDAYQELSSAMRERPC